MAACPEIKIERVARFNDEQTARPGVRREDLTRAKALGFAPDSA